MPFTYIALYNVLSRVCTERSKQILLVVSKSTCRLNSETICTLAMLSEIIVVTIAITTCTMTMNSLMVESFGACARETGPATPLNPLTPFGPLMLLSPLAPLGPASPGGPDNPWLPSVPGGPGGPAGPEGPSLPGGPSVPGVPLGPPVP